jgi:hypothetical protein
MQPNAPAPQRQVTFDQFTDAWNALTKNIGIYAACIFIWALISIVLIGPVSFFLQMAMMTDLGSVAQTNPWAQFTHPLYYGQLLYNMVVGALIAPFGICISRMALRSMRGEMIDIGMMFQFDGRYAQMAVFSLILSFLGTIGFYLCCIPGCIVYALMLPGGLLVLERGLPGVEAFKTSAKDMMPSLLNGVLLVVVAGLVAAVGVVACVIGIFFTMGIWFCVQAAAYRELYDYGAFGDPNAPPQAPGSYYRPPPQG